MIRTEELTKWFGSIRAVTGVCLEVDTGETLVVFGPNGSGKSTLLRLIAGLSRPTSGSIWIDGSDPRAVKARIGFLGHETYLYPHLSSTENLGFYARLYGVRREEPGRLLEAVGMTPRADAPVLRLSRGEKQRTAIARALLHDPDYLLLDEPYTALDESIAAELPSLITRPGRTTILATHQRIMGEAVADKVVRLDAGRLM